MPKIRLFAVLGFLIAFNLFCSDALAATPSFTFTATNVTISSASSSGSGSSSFTLTSVNGYTGTVGIICSGPTPPAGVNVPVCSFGGPAYQAIEALTSNQAVTGTIVFLNSRPPCNPCPVSLPHRRATGLAPGLALAGALLLGFGIRRRTGRWLTLTLFALGTLTGLAGISACGGGNNNAVTPGTYVYTLSAADTQSLKSVTASINVTVP